MRHQAPMRGGRHRFLPRFLISTGLLLILGVMWGLASPVPSGPDEPAQLIKAAGVAHGTLIGTSQPSPRSQGTAAVKVPSTLFNMLQPPANCTYADVDAPVCTPHIASDSKLTLLTTYEARYPPLYYAITGIPWLFTSTTAALHWMRVAGAAVVAVLLGLAFASVSTYGRSGLLTATTGFIVTPTVLYLGGVVNPSGMEVAGGIAVWAALTVLVMHRAEDPPKPLLAALVIGSIGLCGSRPLSTLWFGLALVTVAVLRPATARRLVRIRRVQVAVGLSLLFALASGIYVIVAKSYKIELMNSRASTTKGYLLAIAGHSTKVLRQVVGAFGDPNFSVPLPVEAIWVVAVAALIGAAVLLVGGRDGWVVAAMTVLFGFVLPFLIIYSHVRTDGVIWQGRYELPLIAGIPLIAAAVIHERWPDLTVIIRRVAPVLGTLWLVGNLAGFYWFLRRYTVGLGFYNTNAFRKVGAWKPLISAEAIYAVAVLASVVFAAWLLRQALRVPGATPVRAVAPEARDGVAVTSR